MKIMDGCQTCIHEFQTLDDVTQRCLICGIEKVVTSYIETGAEWREYKDKSTSYSNARCGYRPYNYSQYTNSTTILKETMVDTEFVDSIEDLYKKVVKGDVVRFPFNKAILFICTHTVYKSNQRYLEYGKLQQRFGLTRKQISDGMKYFRRKVVMNKIPLCATLCISTENYICEMCKDLNLDQLVDPNIEHELILLYKSIIDKSEVINHSSAKVIATAVIRRCIKPLCSVTVYKNICGLLISRYAVSDTTMVKVEKEIKNLCCYT